MTGEDLRNVQMMNDFSLSFKNLNFLQSLNVCLKSKIGRNYLHRYLEQNYCDEIVIWLQLIKKFNDSMSNKERFMNARNIIKTCITPTARFAINISHETRTNVN